MYETAAQVLGHNWVPGDKWTWGKKAYPRILRLDPSDSGEA
jgi:hypothetical protein